VKLLLPDGTKRGRFIRGAARLERSPALPWTE